METFGQRLKRLREEAGYTREETAKLSGMSRQLYYSYESGRRKPSLNKLQGLARALNIDYNELIDDEYINNRQVAEIIEQIISELEALLKQQTELQNGDH